MTSGSERADLSGTETIPAPLGVVDRTLNPPLRLLRSLTPIHRQQARRLPRLPQVTHQPLPIRVSQKPRPRPNPIRRRPPLSLRPSLRRRIAEPVPDSLLVGHPLQRLLSSETLPIGLHAISIRLRHRVTPPPSLRYGSPLQVSPPAKLGAGEPRQHPRRPNPREANASPQTLTHTGIGENTWDSQGRAQASSSARPRRRHRAAAPSPAAPRAGLPSVISAMSRRASACVTEGQRLRIVA